LDAGFMRPVVAVALLALSAFVAAVPVAQAQDASAPSLSAEVNLLYAHHDASDTAEVTAWMNTLEQDGDDNAIGPSASCGIEGAGLTGTPLDMLADTDIDRTYTITMDPAPTVTASLGSGPVKATIHFGAGSCEGEVTIASTLSVDGTAIATGQADHTYAAGAPYPALSLDMPLTGTTIPSGSSVVWTVHVTGTTKGAGYMGVSNEQGRTKLQLPITGTEGGALPVKALTGATVDITETINETGDKSFLYRWTGPSTARGIGYTTTGTGNATFTVLDGANATILNETVKGAQSATKTVTGEAGNWSLAIQVTDFKGTVRLTINDPAVTPGPPGSTKTGTGTSTSKASGTGSVTNGTADEDDKDTPVPALPAMLGAIAAAVILARRRR
jgi:hypothetical protein